MTKVAPSKDELERQKLALEIHELQRRWWQRPAYLSILLPIVFGILTVLTGILTGYFDRERTELKRNIEALKRENSALLETQNAIRQANADAEKLLKILRSQEEEHAAAFNKFMENQRRELSAASPTAKPKQEK